MKKIFYLVLLFLGMVCVCTPVKQVKIALQMIAEQEKYVTENVLVPFASGHRLKIDILRYSNFDSIPAVLDANSGAVILVKVPFEKSWSLVRKDKILPLETFLTPEEIKEFDDIYLLTSLGTLNGKHYYIPRKYETRIMIYLTSKVLDAVAVWKKNRQQIHEDLKKYNGYGLPADYYFEEDPNLWDYFDVFVAGWIWAHTPYDGSIAPRIAHRAKMYSGTSHRLIDRVFQCGGDSAAVVTMRGESVVDVFFWESVYAAGNIYNRKMFTEKWGGADIWKGFGSGDVFLAFMTQLDCFFIHGTGEALPGFLKNPDDMAVALMPAGCSLELNQKGEVIRKGTKTITTGGWWWGIPKETPDPRLSYALARCITSMENQVKECSNFGMIPVRKEVLTDMQMLFGGQWISQIYEVSFRQLMQNRFTTVPAHPRMDEIGNVYLAAWDDIVVKKNWSADTVVPDREFIKRRIYNIYGKRIEEIK